MPQGGGKPSLTLSCKVAKWRDGDQLSADADAEFDKARLKRLDKDNHTCRLCGFKAKKWQEVHHVDDDHTNNALSNLATVCIFCHMVQHIGFAGTRGEAVLVWLPEMAQDRLHHVVRSVLVARRWSARMANDRHTQRDMKEAIAEMEQGAETLMATLESRRGEARERFKTDRPDELANALESMTDEEYARRGEFLAGARLLPLGLRKVDGQDKMPEIVDSWMETGGPYANLKPSTWASMLRSAV